MPESINNKVGKAKRWVNKISQQVSKSLSKNTKPQNS
jgi:hypothetical protein